MKAGQHGWQKQNTPGILQVNFGNPFDHQAKDKVDRIRVRYGIMATACWNSWKVGEVDRRRIDEQRQPTFLAQCIAEYAEGRMGGKALTGQ